TQLAQRLRPWNGGDTHIDRARAEAAGGERSGGDDHVLADRDMIREPHPAPDDDPVADGGRAGNADLAAEQAVASDLDVVTDLDLVVDFRPAADPRRRDRALIDAGAGADLDIIPDLDPAERVDAEPVVGG